MISRKKAIELAQDNNTIYAVKDYIHVDIEGRTKYQRLRKIVFIGKRATIRISIL